MIPWTLILLACTGGDDHAEHRGHAVPGEAPSDEVQVTPEAAQALGIRTEPAREGTVRVERRAPATIAYDPLQTVRVATQAGGQVRWLGLPRPGERVRRGQLVARLYDPTVLAAFEELLVARDLGEPWLSAARSRLRNTGVAQGEIEAALAAGEAPETFGLYAPVSGVVVDRLVSEGAWLGPGTRLGTLASEADLVATIVVVEAPPAVGETVTLRDTTTGQTWPARVESLLPTADAAGANLRLVPEGSPPVGRPLVAEWTDTGEAGVWVPRGAVVDTGERQVVFVATAPQRFEPRSVRLGTRTSDEIEIVEGLEPGEPVVVSGTFLLDSETQMGGMGHAGHGS